MVRQAELSEIKLTPYLLSDFIDDFPQPVEIRNGDGNEIAPAISTNADARLMV
jgi:hypothetical protein